MLSFNEDHASKYGLKESIVLHKIIFYVLLNERDSRNCHHGKHWTFNSREGWRSVFPCFSDMQIWRSLKNLEKMGAIISDSFNRRAYDKTRWYTLSEGMLAEVRTDKHWQKAICKSAKTHNKTATPIPVKNNNILEFNPY